MAFCDEAFLFLEECVQTMIPLSILITVAASGLSATRGHLLIPAIRREETMTYSQLCKMDALSARYNSHWMFRPLAAYLYGNLI
jgi:hypothetical protein